MTSICCATPITADDKPKEPKKSQSKLLKVAPPPPPFLSLFLIALLQRLMEPESKGMQSRPDLTSFLSQFRSSTQSAGEGGCGAPPLSFLQQIQQANALKKAAAAAEEEAESGGDKENAGGAANSAGRVVLSCPSISSLSFSHTHSLSLFPFLFRLNRRGNDSAVGQGDPLRLSLSRSQLLRCHQVEKGGVGAAPVAPSHRITSHHIVSS
jgi:hypothetical protein